MNWAIDIFGSGLALFVGVSLQLVAVVPSIGGAKLVRLRTLLAVIGIIFVALSAGPLPLWSYGTIGVLLLAWLTGTCVRRTCSVTASAANKCSTRRDASVMSCGVPKVVNTLNSASSPCGVS